MSRRLRRVTERHTTTLTLIFLCGLLAGSMPSGLARAAGEPCPRGDTECPEGEVCVDAVCQAAEPCSGWDCFPERPCGTDAECPSYQDCVDGVCVIALLPQCGTAVACPAGETCVDGHCVASPDGECSLTRPCPDGDICVAGRCEPGEPTGCRSDTECPGGSCEGGRCVPRTYNPPSLTPLDLPDPPAERVDADDPPVWNLPDDDDPFGDIPPMTPQQCGTDAKGSFVCCTHGVGWSFEKDEVDEAGNSLYVPWTASGSAFGRGPVYGNNVHIDRIKPPGYTASATGGPAANVGGDYWAFSRDVNQQGKWWIGSSDIRTQPSELPGLRNPEKAIGHLRSPRMLLAADYVRFFIGGSPIPSQRVQLEIYEPSAAKRAQLAKLYDGIGVSELPGAAAYLPVPPTDSDYVVVRASAASNGNEFMHRRVAWDIRDFKGKVGRIVIVDANTWGWHPIGHGHVNVDEVLCTDELDDNPTFPKLPKSGGPAKVGAAETPIPLWGTTDTHTHPFVNLAFGGDLVWGDPHDELSDVYSCTGDLPPIAEGATVLRPDVQQRAAQQCGASDLLTATVAALPCEIFAGNPASWPVAITCAEAVWDVLDVLMNQSLAQVESLHGSPSPFSGGVTITGAKEVLQEVTPFMNTFHDLAPFPLGDDFPDFGDIAAALPKHIPGLVERLAWDTDDGDHSQHGIKGHQLYQKDMIRRAYQGGMRLVGLDVIDSRTITDSLGAGYNEWLTIWKTVLSTRHLVSCGNDPLFPSQGPLCAIAGIAYSPGDVRTLVGRNKLAIVLGTETDELGIPRDEVTMALFGHAGMADSIALQIADLHTIGIRKVTAIHALNNPLGGAGIFNDTYLTGTNELSNVVDPGKVEASSITIPFFVAGNFTEDMFAIKHWETDPNDLFWDEWYQDHGGWVALDQTIGDDWIGDGVTFQYGFPSVATPLGYAATPADFTGQPFLFPAPAFHAKGTWAGVNEVQHLKDIDQLLKGGDMCKVDGAGLPLGADEAWVPANVRTEYFDKAATENGPGAGFANAVGLRPVGAVAMQELMKRGMVIDLDHFSQEARVDTWAVAEQLGKTVFGDAERLYPFFGVHTNSRTHERHGPFPDFAHLRTERGYTAETDRTLPEFLRSKQDGGAFSPGANAGYMTDSPEHEPQVRNDCDYSSKSFAHRYLWMMDVMDGRGLTPSTDMSPFFTPAAPRFGQYQCHLRTSYHDDMFGLETAEGEFYHQCPSDFPALPSVQCKSHQWPHDWEPDGSGNELCKIMGRLIPGCPTYDNLQQQYAEGAGVWYEDYAGREDDQQPVQDAIGPQVSWIVARRAGEERDDAAPRAQVDEVVAIGGARQMWPMKKMKTTAGFKLDQAKNTGWDVNLDGFQHIGLYPDFLQDVRNVGVSWERMTPIFNAVEDYVRMWERACELADTWATKDATAPGCH